MKTTRVKKRITGKECESRQHSDSIQQGQSNQKCNFGSKNEEDDDMDKNEEEYTLSKSSTDSEK